MISYIIVIWQVCDWLRCKCAFLAKKLHNHVSLQPQQYFPISATPHFYPIEIVKLTRTTLCHRHRRFASLQAAKNPKACISQPGEGKFRGVTLASGRKSLDPIKVKGNKADDDLEGSVRKPNAFPSYAPVIVLSLAPLVYLEFSGPSPIFRASCRVYFSAPFLRLACRFPILDERSSHIEHRRTSRASQSVPNSCRAR